MGGEVSPPVLTWICGSWRHKIFLNDVFEEGIQRLEVMSEENDDKLRDQIAQLMADGLETQTEPYPEDNNQFEEILDELRKLGDDDLVGKLKVSGFVNQPYGEDQARCLECMYYLVHRKWCDLPELAVPVEPEWWCRLWRI